MSHFLFASDDPAGDTAQRLADATSTEQKRQVLEECSSADLRRTQRQYRRALDALAAGYAGLSDATRERIAGHMQARLRTLRGALPPSRQDNCDDGGSTLLTRLGTTVRGLWPFTADE